MTRITREQAENLRYGALPGPWGSDWEEGDDWYTVTGVPHDGMNRPVVANHSNPDTAALIAAAPDLAETVIAQADEIEQLKAQIGGTSYQWGVEIDRTDAVMDGSTRHVMATARRPSDQIMKIWAEDGRNPVIVRRRVGTWEVMDE